MQREKWVQVRWLQQWKSIIFFHATFIHPNSLFSALILLPLQTSFSPHLFPALLLWLPVSSWPDARPPLGSIPHPEPRGKRGIGGEGRGEKRRRTNGRNERKNHSGSPYIECDVIYLWPRWGGEEQFLLQIVCRFPAFCSRVINLPFQPFCL